MFPTNQKNEIFSCLEGPAAWNYSARRRGRKKRINNHAAEGGGGLLKISGVE